MLFILSPLDSRFFAHLRGLSIFVIVLGHLGGFWIYPPYSEFLHVFVAVFFFLSGATSAPSLEKFNPLKFYEKRVPGLLIPYYLICFCFFIFYIIQQQALPNLNFDNILAWIELRPSDKISPVPFGQIWFLHALIIIIFISPILFSIVNRSLTALFVYCSAILAVATIEEMFVIHKNFYLFDNNFYQPLVHSLFFTLGIAYIKYNNHLKSGMFYSAAAICIILSVLGVSIFHINPDYSHHTFSPDLFYVIGCLAAISFFLAIKAIFVSLIESNFILTRVFEFLFKHTFSIFLIHSSAIFIAESAFNLTGVGGGGAAKIIAKVILVFALTALACLIFTPVCNAIKHRLALYVK